MTTELIEITPDNHALLDLDVSTVGGVATRDAHGTTAFPEFADALASLVDGVWRHWPPDIGECLPVGSGRCWLTLPDLDE